MTELLKPRDELTAIVDNSDYGDVSIPTNLKDHTWFVKYESTNPLLSDTDTGDEWHIQITADGKDHGSY